MGREVQESVCSKQSGEGEKCNGHKQNVFVEDCLFHFSAAVTPGGRKKRFKITFIVL